MEDGMRTQRLVAALLVALSIMAGSSQAVGAHSVYEENWVYWTQDANCTWGRSEISHGSGGGYVRVDVRANYIDIGNFVPCSTESYRSPYQLRAKYTAIKYNEGTGNWDWCFNSQWYYNGTGGATFVIEDWLGNTEPPCGAGWYGNSGGSFVYHNGQWYGDYLYGWQHWLPS